MSNKLLIPKSAEHLKGLRFEPAIRIDYQNFLLEDVLPGLFYVMRVGRRRGTGQWSGRTAADVAAKLGADTDCFEGFGDIRGQKLLEEWLKASILRLPDRRSSEKVMSVRPLHFMAYRADLPKAWMHLRSIPEFVAAILQRSPEAAPLKSSPDEEFCFESSDNLLLRAFGTGMRNDDGLRRPDRDFIDETADLDIESLLTARVVAPLQCPSPMKEVYGFEPLCPRQAAIFREDVTSLLKAYPAECIPVRVLGEYVLCLLSLNLTVYALSHFASSNALYKTGVWADDVNPSQRGWDLGIYVDLTDGNNKRSREISRRSYARHHEWMLHQMRTMLGFRLLSRTFSFGKGIPELEDVQKASGIRFLELLARGRKPKSPLFQMVEAGARNNLAELEQENSGIWDREFGSIANDPGLSSFDALVEILAIGQPDLLATIFKFYTSCARRGVDSGFLGGSGRKQENHYQLGVRMLEMLVQLAVLDSATLESTTIDIYEFARQLRGRYGIWIDEVPAGLDESTEGHAAAQANFDALKEKLRQLGFFRAVNDARRMQRLKPRYSPIGDIQRRANACG